MNDINRQILEARRAQALLDNARRETEAPTWPTAPTDEGTRSTPAGAGRLTLEKRQGEWRYYLCEHRIRVGDPIEFHVDARLGWVRGTFQWGRRNTAPPTVRVPVTHPDDPTSFVGEMVVSLPDDAICRWPDP